MQTELVGELISQGHFLQFLASQRGVAFNLHRESLARGEGKFKQTWVLPETGPLGGFVSQTNLHLSSDFLTIFNPSLLKRALAVGV